MEPISRNPGFISRFRSKHPGLTSAWVTAREAFWIALEALRAHKLRSFLTLLGVVIATTTLIAVMSVINGMNLYIQDHVANLGTNVFILDQFKWAQGYENWLKARRRNRPIRLEEFEFLKENLRDYKAMAASAWWRADLRYQGHALYDVTIRGTTPASIDIGQEKVEFGRYFTDADYNDASMVCFIGQDVVDEFFPSVNPLNKSIEIRGQPLRVIGVAERIGTSFGQSQDNFVHIPLTAFHKMFSAQPRILVGVQAWNAKQMQELEDEARALMRARRHIPYKEDDTFWINESETIMDLWRRLTASIFAVTIAVVAVFMVVGGIVIMNIMLASVTERTHEIGVRKSLGARRRDILTQFIIEAGVMSSVGGIIGIVLAVGISRLVQMVWASSVPLTGVVVGFMLSAAVGLFFGIYPANQAAKLDPIEALRAEH